MRVGLALGGGGARGIAHIGVLDVLEKAGIEIHCAAGTSAGAMVAAAWAGGLSSDDLARIARETEWWFLARPIAFKRGLLSSRGIEGWFRRVVPARTFTELSIPIALTATDFHTGQLVLLTSGELARAVRISCCVPGIYQPVEHGGRFLTDGGLVQNLPVDTVLGLKADVVIAVDLHSDVLGKEDPDSLVVSLIHAANILQRPHERIQASKADIVIEPAVGHLSAVSFRAVEEFIAAGRQAAEKVLPQIRALVGKDEQNADKD